jgi:hypothetical protein
MPDRLYWERVDWRSSSCAAAPNRPLAMRRPVPIVLLAALMLAVPAQAADVISPRDGETVGSKPRFTVDFAEGRASVELSKSASVKTAGDDVGAFVDVAAEDFLLIGPAWGYPAGVAEPWSRAINAGRYFWHAELRDYASDAPAAWTPVRTLTVRDEPAVFEGWTASAVRGRKIEGCSRTLVQGRIAWSDNAARPEVRYTVNVSANGKRIGQIKGELGPFESPGRFGKVLCTASSKLKLTVQLRDGKHTTQGPSKKVTVRHP